MNMFWALFLGRLGSGSASRLMTFLLVHEQHVSVPSSSCSAPNWMSASAHPDLCLGTKIKWPKDLRGWAFVALIRMCPTAGSTEGLRILGWPVFSDSMEMPSWRALSEPICHNTRTISPAVGVFCVLCYGLELVWKGSRVTAASRWDWSLLTEVCCLELLGRVRSGSGIGRRGEFLLLGWLFVIGCLIICSSTGKSQ